MEFLQYFGGVFEPMSFASLVLATVSGLILDATPTGERYSTGHSEGVIAAEPANNEMVGPPPLALFTLSIPGSPTAAVLLGGLLIHGIFPGTDLSMHTVSS